jgi:hypothetical protein
LQPRASSLGTETSRLLQVGDGVFEVLSTSGDTHLGGDDFDKKVVDFLADDFQKSEGIDLRKDRQVGYPDYPKGIPPSHLTQGSSETYTFVIVV